MGIIEVKNTLLKWVHSCETEEQVGLLKDVLPQFFLRFEGNTPALVIQLNKDLLLDEMKEQKLIIKRKYLQTI